MFILLIFLTLVSVSQMAGQEVQNGAEQAGRTIPALLCLAIGIWLIVAAFRKKT